MTEFAASVEEPLGGAPPVETPAQPPQETAGAEHVQPTGDDVPEAVEVAPGQRMVPVGVLKAVREELKTRPKAEDLAALQRQLDESKPYVEFLKNHPHLLNPPAPPEPARVEPQDDPALVELARTLELYDAQTGKPDTARAEKIRNLTRSEAQQIARSEMAPVQERTYQTQAEANVQQILHTTKTADGAPLEAEYLTAAIKSIAAQLPKGEAFKILADPAVANVVRLTALGLQAQGKKSAPAAPQAEVLHRESAGGSGDVPMSDGSRRLARMTGRTEKDWQDAAKRYVPNRANPLE